jgi:hypothetical protein
VHTPLGLLAELTHRCPLGCPLLLQLAAVRTDAPYVYRRM